MGAVQTSARTGAMTDGEVSERGRGERDAAGGSGRAAWRELGSEVAISRALALGAVMPSPTRDQG